MAPRGVAAFFGGFTLLNLAGSFVRRRFDCNLWWIDLRGLPDALAAALLLGVGLSLVGFAVRWPGRGSWRWSATVAFTAFAVLALAVNAAQFFVLLATDRIRSSFPVPVSGLVCVALAWVLLRLVRPSPRLRPPELPRWRRAWPGVAAFGGCLVAFPLAQMLLYGHTDYRRRADAIVVFGARVYADGQPSLALADRVRTGCRLYHEGWADTLIFSGGPGDGAVDEPQAMRRVAMDLGVPDDAMRLDPRGLNTELTVRNTAPLLDKGSGRRLLAVSHAYHLPRVKMAYHRAAWDEVYTVPAEETRTLARMPLLVCREVAAQWVYYLRGQ